MKINELAKVLSKKENGAELLVKLADLISTATYSELITVQKLAEKLKEINPALVVELADLLQA